MAIIPAGRIDRMQESIAEGALGIFRINGKVLCHSLEPANLLNAPFRSNIPGQKQYECVRYYSLKFKMWTFKILDVPERQFVEFHPGNKVKDTKACVLLGLYDRTIASDRLIKSMVTFRLFMKTMEGYDKFNLTITNCY